MRHRIVLETLDPIDEDAVERAASDRVLNELVVHIVAEDVGEEPSPSASTTVLLRRPTGHHRGLAVAAAAVVIVAGVVAGLNPPGSTGSLHGSFTTPWRAARPFASGSSTHPKQMGTWRLLDAQLSGTWQQNVHGPPPGYLTCPTSRACYVMSGHYGSSAANAALLSETLYVSADAGTTWSALPMPNGFAPTTALSCSTATWCAAGGTYQGQPVVVATANAGHSFTLQPLPSGPGTLRALSCPTTDFCGGLVASATSGRGGSATGPPPVRDATFLAITDAGQAFTDEPIASGESMVTLACSSSLDCLALGHSDATENHPGATAVGAVTTDGGRSWKPTVFPTGFGFSPYARLSCTDAAHCMVLGSVPVTISNPPQCASVPQQSSPTPATSSPKMSPTVEAISNVESALRAQANQKEASGGTGFTCTFGGDWTTVSDVAVTTDGGSTWTPEPLPSNVPSPQLTGLACSSASACWVAGQEEVPQNVGTGHDGGSPVLIGTTDGGASWSKVTFSVPSTAPNPTGQSYLNVGSVSCPSAAVCVATGGAAAAASTAPVYSMVIPEG